MIHYFHFTLDRETIELLMNAGELEKLTEAAGFIVRILERCGWFIEKHHFTAGEQGSRYARISEDLADSRVNSGCRCRKKFTGGSSRCIRI